MKIKKSLLDNAAMVLMLIVAGTFILSAFVGNAPFQMVVIDNYDPNSMHPTYQQGDIFLVRALAPAEYKVGDVIIYEPIGSNGLIIHRIIKIYQIDGEYYVTVKGDNFISNSSPDPLGTKGILIHESQIRGKVVVKIPYLGHLSLALQTNTPFQILTLLVAGAIAALIFFGPEEEKKEEEYLELSREAMQEQRRRFLEFSQTTNGKLTIGLISLFVLLIVAGQLSTPLMIDQSHEPGLVNVDYRSTQQNRRADSIDIIFYQITVEMFDSGKPGERIKSVEVITEAGGKEISRTLWTSLSGLRGLATYGASIIFELSQIENVDQQLDVTVVLTFSSGQTDTDSGTVSFTEVLQNA